MPIFTTTLQTDVETGNARYIIIPPEVAEALGGKRGTPVRGTLNGIPYESSLANYSGVFVIPVRAVWRRRAQLEVGTTVEVVMEVDDQRHIMTLPDDLAAAFSAHPAAQVVWDALPPGHKRQHLAHINEAKKPDTRARRIQKMVERLSEGIDDSVESEEGTVGSEQ